MKRITLLLAAIMLGLVSFGQKFEPEKIKSEDFSVVKVKVGGDFALQLQAIDHEAPSADLLDIKHNFNLPTANLSIAADLAPGIQLFMNDFLSSRHHNEAWVEGGYLTIDKLPFLPVTDGIMEYLTIKAGVMSPNYGDAHFYRSNNASVLNNPFVGNWIMDAYTTNPGIEFTFRDKGFLAMVGTNNGRMNYGRGNDIGKDMVFNWKLAYDKQVNDDLRVRASLSGYHVPDGHSGSYLWGGDRAGARYYDVMLPSDAAAQSTANAQTGQWNPGSGQTKMSSYMVNAFVKFYGLEVFGVYENMNGVKSSKDQHFTQTALQAIYRIGSFYLGTRLNKVSDNNGSTVNRTNIGGGWYMTDAVLIKLDHVNQKYDGIAHGTIDGGKFSGLVLEAAISFQLIGGESYPVLPDSSFSYFDKSMNMQLRFLIFVFFLASTFVKANPSVKEMKLLGYLFDEVIITGATNINNFQLLYSENQYSEIPKTTARFLNCLQICIPAKKIEAESKPMLDDFLGLIHADEHPTIDISMNVNQVGELKQGELLNHRICLTMNGISKEYNCLLEVNDCQQGRLCLKGRLNVYFTDFGIDPPLKFFGLVKVRNEVFISFKALFLTENKETKN